MLPPDARLVGQRMWFEYHCWESPQSTDAEIWYRSHQMVEVIGYANLDHQFSPTIDERCEECDSLVYLVRFDDGLEWDVFEDELLDTQEDFWRPDPPRRSG